MPTAHQKLLSDPDNPHVAYRQDKEEPQNAIAITITITNISSSC